MSHNFSPGESRGRVLQLDAVALLTHLQADGQLSGVIDRVAAEEICVRGARAGGLTVSDAELQRAADDFRHRHGLTTAAKTHAWLTCQRMSVGGLESALERVLLVEKLKDVLAQDAAAHFAAQPSHYARVSLRELAVRSEGQARELLRRMSDDGDDFAELASRYSTLPTHAHGGEVGILCRPTIPPAVAELVFAASPGETVGPCVAAGGYYLFRVVEFFPPEWDKGTYDILRQQLFDDWLRTQATDVTVVLSGLPETPHGPA